MKNPKIIYHISWVFALVSLVCIGFSSWNITNQIGGQSLTGSIKADNVINSSEYIRFNKNNTNDADKDGMDIFTYTDIGFVQDGKLSTAGYVTAYYYINAGTCRQLLRNSGDNAIKVECTLTGTNGSSPLSIFSSVSGVRMVTADAEIDIPEMFLATISNEKTTSTDTACTFSFVLRNMLNVGTSDTNGVTISFKFEVPTGTNFTNNFYNKLGASPVFTFNTKISGVTVEDGVIV
ncbi:MAG: hypothetical protein IJX06_00270 [Clostridia bacterium]|nr:hypothetical protein [Clostridia bacterium]